EENGEDENMDDDSDENRELEESDEELYEDNFTVGLIEDVDDPSVGENGAIVGKTLSQCRGLVKIIRSSTILTTGINRIKK
ncbi:unnamed protein product, partial [Didymodactylos carnosus]